MKRFILALLLAFVIAFGVSPAAPAQAQSQCGGNPNCFYVYVLFECYQSNTIPNPGTVQVQLKATDSTTVNTYNLITEWAGNNQRLMSVLVTNVSSSKFYDRRFLRNGGVLSNWTYVGKPPGTIGLFYKYWC